MTVQPSPIIDERPGVVASVDQIDAWLALAKPGDRMIYASRMSLPVRSLGAMRMRTLAARGYVHLIRPRSALDPTIFNYTAERSSTPLPGAKPAGRPVLAIVAAPVVEAEAAVIDALLPVLARFARHGRPCPTDKQLAEKARLTEDEVKGGLEAMAAARLIVVQGCAAPTYRRVLILATGQITGIAA